MERSKVCCASHVNNRCDWLKKCVEGNSYPVDGVLLRKTFDCVKKIKVEKITLFALVTFFYAKT